VLTAVITVGVNARPTTIEIMMVIKTPTNILFNLLIIIYSLLIDQLIQDSDYFFLKYPLTRFPLRTKPLILILAIYLTSL
jgi:hypothetical protein